MTNTNIGNEEEMGKIMRNGHAPSSTTSPFHGGHFVDRNGCVVQTHRDYLSTEEGYDDHPCRRVEGAVD